MKTVSLAAVVLTVLAAARYTLPQQSTPNKQKERTFTIHIEPAGAVWAANGVPGPAIVLKPIIRYVPGGTVLSGMATVSADRRYVTITTDPQKIVLMDMRSIDVDFVLAVAADLAAAPAAANAVAAPPPVLTGRYAEIAKEVKPSPKQRAGMVKVLRDKTVAEAEWDLVNGAELARLRLQQARPASASAGDNARRKIETLRAKRHNISAGYHKQIMGLLSRPQRLKADGYLLANEVQKAFAALALSTEQTAKIRRICEKAARGYASAADIAEDKSIRARCIEEAALTVLNADQRRKYASRNAPTPGTP